ncbi:MAG: DUF6644 family protein [Pseudomonadota bacterium]
MTDAAPAIFVALEASALGAAIRQSSWIYMAANVGHIVSLLVFFSAVAIMDLRMAGLFASTAPDNILRGARKVAIIGFLGLLLTGSMLFTAEASHVITNKVFLLKLALIALGLINIAIFEYFTAPQLKGVPPHAVLPSAARTAGIVSLVTWVAVAICGRSIAYF